MFTKIDSAQERATAILANAVIHTNAVMSRIWEGRYNSGRVHTLPFCYTQDMLLNLPPMYEYRSGGGLRLLYAGLRNDDRNLGDFISAVGEIKNDGSADIRRLKVTVAGNSYRPGAELVRQYSLNEQFEFVGQLSREDMPSLYSRADVLMAVDSSGTLNVHFPSKLMDCFYWRRPILGLTPERSCTWEMLREAGHICVRRGDVPSLKASLLSMLSESPRNDYDKDYYKRFVPEMAASGFGKILNSVL